MTSLSKLWNKVFLPEWSFKYNCYETAHTWTPYCSVASCSIAMSAFQEGLKMYSALNFIQFLLNRKFDSASLLQAITNTLNSSTFLGMNGFLMFSLFCGLRRASGKFYYTLVAFIPCFLASYLAIFIERPHRRSALALYLINIASECLYRVGIRRKLIQPLPHGDVLLFTVSMSILMYMYRTRGLGNDPISLLIKTLIGREESKSGIRRSSKTVKDISNNNKNPEHWANHDGKTIEPSAASPSSIWRHPSCPHTSSSCLAYILRGFAGSFGVSWGIMSIIGSLKNPAKFLQDPAIFLRAARNRKNVSFGMFLGLFVSSFRAINCILRRSSDGAKDWHALVAGMCASSTMLCSPNSTVATYVTWKCIENCYCLGFSKGILPDPGFVIPAVYAACVSIIFYCGVLAPETVRPSYVKFMDSVTKHKIHLFNRNVLAVFRTGAEKGYENFIPDLDPKYCSKAFIETNLVWLLAG